MRAPIEDGEFRVEDEIEKTQRGGRSNNICRSKGATGVGDRSQLLETKRVYVRSVNVMTEPGGAEGARKH